MSNLVFETSDSLFLGLKSLRHRSGDVAKMVLGQRFSIKNRAPVTCMERLLKTGNSAIIHTSEVIRPTVSSIYCSTD